MVGLALLLASLAAAASGSEQQPVPSGVALGTVTLAAVGDIRLNGPVGELIAAHGFDYPTAGVKDLLSADIVFGNLETAVTRRGEKRPKTWNFRSPPRNLEALRRAGFDILNLANNHTMDYGETGFLDTLAAVRKAGFIEIGGGRDLEHAQRLKIVTRHGLRVGFLGFTSTFPIEAWAKKRRPGVNYSDFDHLADVIRDAKTRCDVLVVSFHGGTELATEVNQIQKDFAHLAVLSGADLVLGHHPHVIQSVEIFKGKPILYSLGNFLFVSPTPTTRPTVIARATLSAKGVERIELVPIDTNWGAPKPASADQRQTLYDALNGLGALQAYPGLLALKP